MHCDAFHHQNADSAPPALPVRSLRKVTTSDLFVGGGAVDPHDVVMVTSDITVSSPSLPSTRSQGLPPALSLPWGAVTPPCRAVPAAASPP